MDAGSEDFRKNAVEACDWFNYYGIETLIKLKYKPIGWLTGIIDLLMLRQRFGISTRCRRTICQRQYCEQQNRNSHEGLKFYAHQFNTLFLLPI